MLVVHWPSAFFITFCTYCTHIHGDKRGTVDSEHNVYGTPVLNPDRVRLRMERDLCKGDPVRLDSRQRVSVRETIKQVCAYRGWQLHAVNVRTNHVHVVVGADVETEKVMAVFKSWATRRLVEDRLFPRGGRAWARNGSTGYLWKERDVAEACEYVVNWQDVK